jgi:hypothetical protein
MLRSWEFERSLFLADLVDYVSVEEFDVLRHGVVFTEPFDAFSIDGFKLFIVDEAERLFTVVAEGEFALECTFLVFLEPWDIARGLLLF